MKQESRIMNRKNILYFFFFVNLFIIGFFWWQGSGLLVTSDILADKILGLGKLSGLLAVYFILLQFVMRGRAVWVEEAFGLNNLATVHRLNGYLSLGFILTHFTLILTSYSLMGKTDLFSQFIRFLYDSDLLNAFIALLLFTSIVFVSVYIVRKKLKYETWYYIHLATYAAIFLAWGHQLKLGSDFAISDLFVWYWYFLYIFVFGNLIIFRWLRQVLLFLKYRFFVANVVKEADGATSVYIGGNNISQFKIHPGQFMILRFLDSKRWLEAHPFSLSFLPKNNQLRLTIKNVGDFTKDIAKLKKGTSVLLDGPLGTFTSSHATKDKYLFIAGGVGITPIRSLIEELGPLKKDMILLYSSKTKDLIFKEEIDELAKKYKFSLYYVVTEDASFRGEKGRIDAEKIKRLAPDFRKRDIYLCGPVPMMDALIKTLAELGVSESSIHYERFSL